MLLRVSWEAAEVYFDNGSQLGTSEVDAFEILFMLIEKYETEKYTILSRTRLKPSVSGWSNLD